MPLQRIARQNGCEERGTFPEVRGLSIMPWGSQKACQFAQYAGAYRLPAHNKITGNFGFEGMRHRIVGAVVEDQRAGSALNLAFQKERTHRRAQRMLLITGGVRLMMHNRGGSLPPTTDDTEQLTVRTAKRRQISTR